MSELHRSASEIMRDLMQRSPSESELARRRPKVPPLRLREDTPTIEVDRETRVADALMRLEGEHLSALALRDNAGRANAVVVPADRYIELVGRELATHAPRVATLNGQLVPEPSELASSYVEQVDPADSWKHDRPQ